VTEPLYRSRCTIARLSGLHRRATLATGEAVDFGVHGPIQELFQLAPDRPRPLPVDYVVAAAGG